MKIQLLWAVVTTTFCLTSAGLPSAKTNRVNETFAVRFVVVNGWGLVMTKLKLLVAPGSRPVRFRPMIHLVDWPTILPWASSRKQTARADSIFSGSPFFIASFTTAFWPTIFAGETATTSCAIANNGQNNIAIKTKCFMELNVGNSAIVDGLNTAILRADIAGVVASLTESEPDVLG